MWIISFNNCTLFTFVDAANFEHFNSFLKHTRKVFIAIISTTSWNIQKSSSPIERTSDRCWVTTNKAVEALLVETTSPRYIGAFFQQLSLKHPVLHIWMFTQQHRFLNSWICAHDQKRNCSLNSEWIFSHKFRTIFHMMCTLVPVVEPPRFPCA